MAVAIWNIESKVVFMIKRLKRVVKGRRYHYGDHSEFDCLTFYWRSFKKRKKNRKERQKPLPF